VLKLKVSISENLLQDISNSNVNPKTLKLQHRGRSYGNVFSEYDRIEFIQKFTQLKTFKAIMDCSMVEKYRDVALTSITTLFVQISGDLSASFNLDWILSMFPLLEELYMGYSSVGIGGKPSPGARKTYPKLRLISIMDCGIHQGFFNYIKVAAPNLNELELSIDNRSTIYYYSQDKLEYKIHIDLTELNLSRCELLLDDESLSGDHEFRCTIKIKNRSKKVIFHQRNKALGIPSEEDDDDEEDDVNTVVNATIATIISDDIKDFKINGYSVRKIDNEVLVGL
jgi:hypothetical protein